MINWLKYPYKASVHPCHGGQKAGLTASDRSYWDLYYVVRLASTIYSVCSVHDFLVQCPINVIVFLIRNLLNVVSNGSIFMQAWKGLWAKEWWSVDFYTCIVIQLIIFPLLIKIELMIDLDKLCQRGIKSYRLKVPIMRSY